MLAGILAAAVASAPNNAFSTAAPESGRAQGIIAVTGPQGDFVPRHGGLYLPSTDYRHSVEGKLIAPGRFRLWIYGADGQPLSAEHLRAAKSTVQWGSGEAAPKTPLTPVREEQYLEASPPAPPKLPITLTLRIVFPDNPPGTKPETFTFPFARMAVETGSTPKFAPETAPADHSGSGHTIVGPGEKSADTLERHPPH